MKINLQLLEAVHLLVHQKNTPKEKSQALLQLQPLLKICFSLWKFCIPSYNKDQALMSVLLIYTDFK